MALLDTKDIDVVILCGGWGKRLRSIVADRPKPMVEINGHPFLDILIDHAIGFGFRRFVLCIGYKSSIIRQYYQNSGEHREIIFSEEKKLLGTAGAIKKAEPFIISSPFLVANGDSFCEVDLKKFIKFHVSKKALVSIVLTSIQNPADYGNVVLGHNQRISKFSEKGKSHKNSFVNAGLYLFQKEVLSLIPSEIVFSLEQNLFPKIIDRSLYGYITQGIFLDIGTPQRYKKAEELLSGYGR